MKHKDKLDEAVKNVQKMREAARQEAERLRQEKEREQKAEQTQ